jgi:thiol-disulfide isomerase/thioredoxin
VTQTNDPEQTRGALRTDQNQLIFGQGFSFSGYERDPLYLNRCNKTFLEISGVSGLDSISDGRGAVFADFDNDGDLDVFMTTIQGQTHLLFRNNIGQANHHLRILLEGGAEDGRDAFGAVVRVKTSAGILTKIKSGGAGFLSQHDPRLLFGLGEDESAQSIEVRWPDGTTEHFDAGAQAGKSLLLRRGAGRAQALALGRTQLPDPLTRAESFALSLKIAVGEPMPDLPLKTLAGAATSLREQLPPGRRALINVWATWCLPCAREMPELERLRPRLSARGIELIGLNVDTEPTADIGGFLAKTGAQYASYAGGVAAIERLYATDELIVPMSVLLDEKGTVIEIIPGWSDETRRRFAWLAGSEAGN